MQPNSRHAEPTTQAKAEPRATISCKAYLGALVVLIVVALAVRIAMLVDFLHSNPSAGMVGGDAGVYWEAAGRIAQGQWIDSKPFLHAPLYPYLLALLRMCGGGSTTTYVVQLLAHLGTALLIARLATRKFDHLGGLMAAAIFLLMEEPAFRVNRVLPSTAQLFVATLVLFTADRFARRGGIGNAALTGLLAGVFALLYPPALILLPVLFVWMWVRAGSHRAAMNDRDHLGSATESAGTLRPNSTSGFLCGLAALSAGCAAIAPATLHNWLASGEVIPITAHGGVTFRLGNAPGATGIYTPLEGVRTFKRKQHHDTARAFESHHGRPGSYREIDGFFFSKGLEYVAADPVRAAGLTARKLYWFLTGRHYSDIYYPSLEQADGLVNLMPLSPLPTHWLMGPAIAGLIIGRRMRRWNAIDLALLVLPIVIVAAFWYTPRYRLPAIPMLCIAAAGGAALAWQARRRDRNHRGPLYLLGALTICSIAVGPINAVLGFDKVDDYRRQYESNLGQVHAQLGDYEQALTHFAESDRLAPDQPHLLAAMASAYTHLGRFADAEQVCRRLMAIAPDATATWLTSGTLLLKLGNFDRALDAFERCLTLDPADADAHLGAWFAMSGQGQRAAAIEHLETAIELDPFNALAVGEYGIWLAEHGQLARAEELLRRAVSLGPDLAEARFNLAAVLVDRGKTSEAAALFREALGLNPDYHKAHRRLSELEGTAPEGSAMMEALRMQIARTPHDGRLYSQLAGLLMAGGDAAGAVGVLRRAVEQAGDKSTVSVELAWLLSTSPDDSIRNGSEAVHLITDALEESPARTEDPTRLEGVPSSDPAQLEGVRTADPAQLREPRPELLDVLAAALAEAGRFDEAANQARRGAALADRSGQTDLANAIRRRLELYTSHRPYRQR